MQKFIKSGSVFLILIINFNLNKKLISVNTNSVKNGIF